MLEIGLEEKEEKKQFLFLGCKAFEVFGGFNEFACVGLSRNC
jgi:hypothetical protein